jgi:predicted AlkP superfamily pyrophosphatase or phosphodiesterase
MHLARITPCLIPRLLLLAALAVPVAAKQPLVVISVDGLDNRYLQNADLMGLKIPNLRRLKREGQYAKGIIGVVPTITWPSHTTMITGVDPVVHGILGNRRPKSDGGDYYLSASLIKTPTLIEAVRKAGLTAAAITWPVTVDAPVNWNLPEYFKRRQGGSMDLESIGSRAKPADLVDKIAAEYPSFPQEWMDDRTRTLAAVYLLKHEHPDLMLVHLVDLDSEEHENAPFTRQANAVLERTDELIGQILAALPGGSALAIVSDHGFERVNQMVNLKALAAKQGVMNLAPMGGIVVAQDQAAADFLRNLARKKQYGVGREIPRAEIARFPATLPSSAVAVFEPAEGFMFFGAPNGEVVNKPAEIGNHGHWPMRYRSVYVLWGPGISHETLPEFSLKDIAGRFANVLGVPFQH